MSLTTRVGLAGTALTLTCVGSVYAAGETAGNDDMAQRLAAAEAKIAAMEAAQNENWLTEQRATEIRGLVQDVLADADTRASLLQTGMTAGYDNGAVIGSADGNNLLRINVLLQPRFIYNSNDSDSEDQRYGFEVTRAKLVLSGHVVDPSWYFMISNNFGNNSVLSSGIGDPLTGSDSREGLGNAYVGKDFGNGLKLQMGSMKAPLLREDLVDAQYQLAVERSTVNYLYTAGYVDGIQLSWESDKFRVAGMFSDGMRTGNTIWSAPDTDFAFTARGEFLVSGNWEQFHQFTSPKGTETGIMIGAAVHYQSGESDTLADGVDVFVLTVDASAQFSGWNLYGAINYANIDTDVPGASTLTPFGWVVQGGFYLDETWEIFGRYEFNDSDTPGLDNLNVITVGVNKYFAGQNVKWTTDVGYSFDSIEISSDITGLREDEGGSDGQFIIRTQRQLQF
jgi:hypothetical protein